MLPCFVDTAALPTSSTRRADTPLGSRRRNPTHGFVSVVQVQAVIDVVAAAGFDSLPQLGTRTHARDRHLVSRRRRSTCLPAVVIMCCGSFPEGARILPLLPRGNTSAAPSRAQSSSSANPSRAPRILRATQPEHDTESQQCWASPEARKEGSASFRCCYQSLLFDNRFCQVPIEFATRFFSLRQLTPSNDGGAMLRLSRKNWSDSWSHGTPVDASSQVGNIQNHGIFHRWTTSKTKSSPKRLKSRSRPPTGK